ncbi:MAG: hypothetical protein F6K45_21330 [Kamptonema sp. SIO1D9]|nr:hypothetical protein [Kamptonema sp. SIO1D9]
MTEEKYSIRDSLQSQHNNLKVQSLKRFTAKEYELFSALQIITRGAPIHAFMYAKYPRLATRGMVEKFDVGAANGWQAILHPFSSVQGGLQITFVPEVQLPWNAVKFRIANLDAFRYAIWKIAVRSIPSALNYKLVGSNCVTWTVTASVIAKALESTSRL